MAREKVKAEFFPELRAALPQAPRAAGVYLFKDAGGRVLYVGKAVNLKNRLASYLKKPGQHDPKTALMLKRAARVDYVLTSQAREALILERNLIKKHAPRFNVRLRDDKNFLCLRLNLKDAFPALRLVRRFAADGALYFGPYTSSGAIRETLKVMKQVFGLQGPQFRSPDPTLSGRPDGPLSGSLHGRGFRGGLWTGGAAGGAIPAGSGAPPAEQSQK